MCADCLGSAMNCTACADPSMWLNPATGDCSAPVSNCTDQQFYNMTDNTCNACDNDCEGCTNTSTNCKACKSPMRWLNPNTGDCSQDKATCGNGKFLNETDNSCGDCMMNCMTCTNATDCSACMDMFWLVNDTCSACVANCKNCTDGATCNECVDDWHVDRDTNVCSSNNCDNGTYWDMTNYNCT
jgi:hypothetical protein